MIVTGLVAALVRSSYKWGFFTFGCAAFVAILYIGIIEGRSYARVLGPKVSKAYTACGVWTFLLWTIYPIAFGVSEGGNIISSDSEAVFYGILDILAKPGFGALLLWGHRNISPSDLGLVIRDAAEHPTSGNTKTETSTAPTNDYGSPANQPTTTSATGANTSASAA